MWGPVCRAVVSCTVYGRAWTVRAAPGQLLPFPNQAAAPPRRQTHLNQPRTREQMEEEDDDSCTCCGSWNTFMGTYPGLHQKCDGGCGDWLCKLCSFHCPECGSQTCESCTGSLQRLPTASNHASPEHPLHRFIKLEMSFGNCGVEKSNVVCDLYAGINPFCSRRCADKMMEDLFALDDEDCKTACSALSLKTSGTV